MADIGNWFSGLFSGASADAGLLGKAGDLGGALTGDAGNIGGAITDLLSGMSGSKAGAPTSAPSPVLSQALAPPPAAQPAVPPQGAPTGGPSAAAEALSIPNASGSVDPSLAGPQAAAGVAPAPNPIAGDLGKGTGSTALASALGNGKGIGNILKQIIPAATLGYDIYKGTQTPPQIKGLEKLAGTDAGLVNSFGAQAQAESQGLLPSGARELVQNSLDAQIAAIRGKYAQLNMSGSTAEIQDINAAKSQALALQFQIGQQLASTGLNEVTQASGQESELLQAILQAETQQGSALGDALAQFAGAAAKGQVPA